MTLVDPVDIGTTNYGRHWLDRPAAESWQRMVRDGCPAAGITDAGRTQQEQIDVFLRHFTTDYAASARHDPRVWQGRTYWRRPGKPSAATPGSRHARHVSGRALDLNGPTKAWVRAHGHRYGWIKDLVGGEDWHMEYQDARDVVRVANAGVNVGIPNLPTVRPTGPLDYLTPLSEEDDDMRIIDAGEAGSYLLTGGRLLGLDAETRAQLVADDVPATPITAERYLQWIAGTAPGVLAVSPVGGYLVSELPGVVPFRPVGSMAEVAAYRGRGYAVTTLPQDQHDALWTR